MGNRQHHHLYRVTRDNRRLIKPRNIREIHLDIYSGNYYSFTVDALVLSTELEFGKCQWEHMDTREIWYSTIAHGFWRKE